MMQVASLLPPLLAAKGDMVTCQGNSWAFDYWIDGIAFVGIECQADGCSKSLSMIGDCQFWRHDYLC